TTERRIYPSALEYCRQRRVRPILIRWLAS
ncbi:MAG: hypothetical protein EZS28_045488, partial [Streblomastix strix]